MAMALLLLPLAQALRAVPEEPLALDLTDFPELCDPEIVRDSCRLLNEGEKHENVEKFTTWQATSHEVYLCNSLAYHIL